MEINPDPWAYMYSQEKVQTKIQKMNSQVLTLHKIILTDEKKVH